MSNRFTIFSDDRKRRKKKVPDTCLQLERKKNDFCKKRRVLLAPINLLWGGQSARVSWSGLKVQCTKGRKGKSVLAEDTRKKREKKHAPTAVQTKVRVKAYDLRGTLSRGGKTHSFLTVGWEKGKRIHSVRVAERRGRIR